MINLCLFRSCSDRAVKLEASVETYRKKLEDLSDLRRQVKVLEEKNMTYMHNTVSLEEELRKANAARAQLETYKRQVLFKCVTSFILAFFCVFCFFTQPLNSCQDIHCSEGYFINFFYKLKIRKDVLN